MAQPATGFAPAPAAGQPPLNLAGVHSRPDFDVIELLPKGRPTERLRQMRQRRDDTHAVIPDFETIREASMAKIAASAALKRLTDHPQDGGFNLPPDNRSVVEAQLTLVKSEEEFKRLQERQATRSAAWRAASEALVSCEAWLKDRPGGTVLEDWDGPAPRLA